MLRERLQVVVGRELGPGSSDSKARGAHGAGKDHFLWLERGLFGASRKEVKAQSQLESTSEFAAV